MHWVMLRSTCIEFYFVTTRASVFCIVCGIYIRTGSVYIHTRDFSTSIINDMLRGTADPWAYTINILCVTALGISNMLLGRLPLLCTRIRFYYAAMVSHRCREPFTYCLCKLALWAANVVACVCCCESQGCKLGKIHILIIIGQSEAIACQTNISRTFTEI